MASRPTSSLSVSSLWLIVLSVGVMLGIAAALLSGVFSSSGAKGPTTIVEPSSQLVVWIVIFVPLVFIAFLIFNRVRNGAIQMPNRVVLSILLMIILLVIFVVVVRIGITTPNPPQTVHVTSPENGTVNHTQQNTTKANVTGPGDNLVFFGITLPSWTVDAIVGAVVATVAIAMTVWFVRRSSISFPPLSAPSPQAIRAELETAAKALAAGSEDPRQILIDLYARLIRRLEPSVGDLATSTAEEIRTEHLVRLGVQPKTADEITRLFERACYSSHPILPEEALRARSVLTAAVGDLDRAGIMS